MAVLDMFLILKVLLDDRKWSATYRCHKI